MYSFALRLRSLLRRPSRAASVETPAHPFDVAHGVDTSGLFYPDKLPTGHVHDRYSEGYYATAPSLFHGLMAQWQATLPDAGRALRFCLRAWSSIRSPVRASR